MQQFQKAYLVSYDLSEEGEQNYPDLRRILERLDRHAFQLLKSAWVIRTADSASAIRHRLKMANTEGGRPILHESDRVLVTEITNNSSWIGLDDRNDELEYLTGG